MVMATKHSLQLLAMLIFLISLLALTKPTMADDDIPEDFSSSYFPDDFIFGTATSAYQIEGEATTKGRGPSVWDTFSKETPERILDGSNGDVAVDFYNRFKEDIANVKNMGFKGFRMSISWSRVIPSGRRREGVNKEGIEFYNNVINEIISNGLEPLLLFFIGTLLKPRGQPIHGGQIGITLFTFWYEPLSNEPADVEAAKTALDFMFGLWMDPMTYGTYPRTVRDLVGDRLPKFTDEESKLLRGSYDFLGLQYYTSYYAKPNATVDPNHIRYKTDNHITETPYDYDGNLIGPQAYSSWFYIFPKGIRHLLNYTKDTYNNPVIYITENGVDNNNNETQPIEEALQDEFRINYYRKHLWNALGSLKNYSVNVKGYFAWSYLDNFEWNIGYTSRFGLYYVDYKDNLKRYPKDSAKWFTKFLKHSPKKPLQSNKIYEVTSRNSRKVGKYYIM
ncbi:hypothetical protein GH714_015127 [Hevea brasiliensis]|uniref:Beta-glucosidase n=1 Tax=Hevea brasiliensis TaxID=3981 RepID=A0A6A6MZK4_HEVBR|nr:hypothetical protein GH714_015127 [Hevea brasiliensis]